MFCLTLNRLCSVKWTFYQVSAFFIKFVFTSFFDFVKNVTCFRKSPKKNILIFQRYNLWGDCKRAETIKTQPQVLTTNQFLSRVLQLCTYTFMTSSKKSVFFLAFLFRFNSKQSEKNKNNVNSLAKIYLLFVSRLIFFAFTRFYLSLIPKKVRRKKDCFFGRFSARDAYQLYSHVHCVKPKSVFYFLQFPFIC